MKRGPAVEGRVELDGRRVLVVGGTGFVGRAVAAAAARAGATVRVPAREPDHAQRLFGALGIAADVVPWDATGREACEELVHAFGPHVVFNLAGYGVDPRERDPETFERLNARLPAWLLDAAARHRAGDWPGTPVVHTGSALEYGTAAGDLSEDTEPAPTTAYGQSKLEGTIRLAAAAESGDLPSVTARLFTVYGPGERRGRLLPSLLEASRSGTHLPLTAGEQRRDFTYVGDVAEGLLRLASRRGAPGALVNLATGRLHTVRAFVERAAAVLGIPDRRLGFGELPTRPEEMQHDPVSVTRLHDWLDWVPTTTISDGVRETIRQQRRREVPPTS